MSKPPKIPESVLGERPEDAEGFAKQQDRIAEWVQNRLTEDIEKHANEEDK